FTDFRRSAHPAATASRRSSRHHTFSAPGTGFFAAETEVRNRPSLLPENERLEGRIGKARRSWAFSARLHMSAENVNAWWWMQPPSNRSLSLQFGEMQGDFRKMQGGGHRNLVKSNQISIAWIPSPYSSEQGRSRENHLCLAGWWRVVDVRAKGRMRSLSRRPGAPQSLQTCLLEPRTHLQRLHSRNVSWILGTVSMELRGGTISARVQFAGPFRESGSREAPPGRLCRGHFARLRCGARAGACDPGCGCYNAKAAQVIRRPRP